MNKLIIYRITYTVNFTLIAMLVDWLIKTRITPFDQAFLIHAWTLLNFLPYKLGNFFSNNANQPIFLLVLLGKILQWAFLGFMLSIPISKVLVKKKSKSS